jgi:hypothetical protein
MPVFSVSSFFLACTTTFCHCGAQEVAHPSTEQDLAVPATKQVYEHAYRLLINVYVTDDGSLRVASLAPNSPATDMVRVGRPGLRGILEPGDIITHVNHTRIDSLKTYYEHLDDSNGEDTATIIDKYSGRPFDWLVRAQKVQTPFVPQEEGLPQNRVAHVLLIGLTEDGSIGEPIGISLEYLKKTFADQFDSEQLDLKVVSGQECNARAIVEDVRQLGSRSRPGDSILVYYLGHGAYDPRFAEGDPSGGHHFQIPSGDLMRRTLFENVLAQPGRLKVLVTDTCNVYSLSMVPKDMRMESRTVAVVGPTNLEQLLLYHRGFLDVSASSRDQFSWFSFRFGGWFTLKFTQIISGHQQWPGFLDQLSKDSNAFFLENKRSILENPGNTPGSTLAQLRHQAAMTPAIFRMSLDKDEVPVGGPQRMIEQTVVKFVPRDEN